MTNAMAEALATLIDGDVFESKEGPKWRPKKARAGIGGIRCNCCRPKAWTDAPSRHNWRGRNNRYKNYRRV